MQCGEQKHCKCCRALPHGIVFNLRALPGVLDDWSTERQDALLRRSDARADGELRRGVPGAARPGPSPRQSQVSRQRQEACTPPSDLGSIHEGQGASVLCCARACAHGTRSSRLSRNTQHGSTSQVTVTLQRTSPASLSLIALARGL